MRFKSAPELFQVALALEQKRMRISHRTVGKHLERSFRKLGVGDRSTAAARVWELAGVSGDGSGL